MDALAPAHAQAGEVQVAIMNHGVRSAKESGVDAEVGYVTAPIVRLRDVGAPRLLVGFSANDRGGVSFGSAALVWRRRLAGRLQGEFQFGYAIHNGKLDTRDPEIARRHLLLGSRDLFRTAIGLDLSLGRGSRVGIYGVHLSHGQVLGRGRNQGLNAIGVRFTREISR
ncbi:MAG: hypothetical protein ACOY9C_14420 [Pseudomonadota bacterium]